MFEGYLCMNKIITGLTFFIFIAFQVQAQEQIQQKHQLQLHAGLSWIGVFVNIANDVNVVEDIDISATPSFYLSYDNRIYERVSLGAAVAYQRINAFYNNYQYEQDGQTITEDFGSKLTRLNFSVRALYWYQLSQSLRLYSGIRLGISNWSSDTNVGDPNFSPDRFINLALGATVAPQLILLGGNFPLSTHWKLGGELAVGAPYFISGGVTYAW